MLLSRQAGFVDWSAWPCRFAFAASLAFLAGRSVARRIRTTPETGEKILHLVATVERQRDKEQHKAPHEQLDGNPTPIIARRQRLPGFGAALRLALRGLFGSPFL